MTRPISHLFLCPCDELWSVDVQVANTEKLALSSLVTLIKDVS